jgi:hypothetical protein
MTSDLISIADAREERSDEALTAAATVWATISVIDELTIAAPGGRACPTAQRRVESGLRELGHEKLELYEYIVGAIERGDWAALGVARGDPPT